jgi:hypothetical protein
MTALEATEVERRFVYHAPDEETRVIHDDIRARVLAFAAEMNEVLEPSRETSLFFTSLEEASFWAHAHIARNR